MFAQISSRLTALTPITKQTLSTVICKSNRTSTSFTHLHTRTYSHHHSPLPDTKLYHKVSHFPYTSLYGTKYSILFGKFITISFPICKYISLIHEILDTFLCAPYQKVPGFLQSKMSASKISNLDGAPHHKVLQNVKYNAACSTSRYFMASLNGDRVRYIKYQIPCNKSTTHEILDTFWGAVCIVMAAFY